MIVVHLITRLLTLVLDNKTPYEALFKHKPSYEHLRVFGCLAFASNPQLTYDKFQARGIPCVSLDTHHLKKATNF